MTAQRSPERGATCRQRGRVIARRDSGWRSKDHVNRAELVERLALAMPRLSPRDVELAVRILLAHLSEALASGQRIELRGFGSFSLRYVAPRVGRNPRTGHPVSLPGRYIHRFKKTEAEEPAAGGSG